MVRKNKRGSGLFDIYVIFLFLFVVIFFSALSIFIYTNFNTEFQKVDSIDSHTKTITQEYRDLMASVLDGGIILWILILWIGSLITSFYLDNSPAWFIIFFMFSLISFFALLPLSNIQSDLSETELSTGYSNLKMSMYISDNVILFIVAFIVSIGMTLYIKSRL